MSARVRLIRLLAIAALAGGCTTLPEPAPRVEPGAPDPSVSTEQAWRERAHASVKDRRWADALEQWELLALLRPESDEYRTQLKRTRERIAESAQKSLAAADQARQRGDLDRAQVEYLRVLSVDHGNAQAAEGLRAIERARVQRNYLNRKPRLAM